jgi:transcription initiation factor TFIIB
MATPDTASRVTTRIEEVSAEIGVADETTQTAVTLFSQLAEDPDFDLHRADPLGASVLVIACRRDGLPITVSDVTDAWANVSDDSPGHFEPSNVYQRMRKVKEATGMGALPPSPQDLIDRFAEELGLPDALAEAAVRLLEDASESDDSVGGAGKSPSGIAAGSVYLAARINDRRMEFPQYEIAAVADVSEVTIRNRYQHLAELLGGEEHLTGEDRYAVNTDQDSTAAEPTSAD